MRYPETVPDPGELQILAQVAPLELLYLTRTATNADTDTDTVSIAVYIQQLLAIFKTLFDKPVVLRGTVREGIAVDSVERSVEERRDGFGDSKNTSCVLYHLKHDKYRHCMAMEWLQDN